MSPEQHRQVGLARKLGRQFCDADMLVPVGLHSSLTTYDMAFGLWCTSRIIDFAWVAVAHHLTLLAGPEQPIDHAWLFGYPVDDAQGEPWGLVTEPYMAEGRARALAHLANDAMADWQVTTHVLPASESAWNPGRCTPIVCVMGKDVPAFLGTAVPWGLQHLKPAGY